MTTESPHDPPRAALALAEPAPNPCKERQAESMFRTMPALSNPRQERFCQLVKQGIPRFRAYPMAGYAANPGAPYRLYENVRVKRRIAELTKGLAMKTRVTVESISEQLDEDRAFAVKVEQAGPALNATLAKAKLHGLIIDRKESGQPGDFAGLTTAEDVLAMVRKELGDSAAAALQAALVQPELSETTPALDASMPPDSPVN